MSMRISTDLSQANWAHAYGRAISSSGFIDVATLRERVSSDRANSISSDGRGPLNVGMRPVRACSMVARLIFVGILGRDVVWWVMGWLVFLACAHGTFPSRSHVDARPILG